MFFSLTVKEIIDFLENEEEDLDRIYIGASDCFKDSADEGSGGLIKNLSTLSPCRGCSSKWRADWRNEAIARPLLFRQPGYWHSSSKPLERLGVQGNRYC